MANSVNPNKRRIKCQKTTEQTSDYQPQLERIRQKLPLAKAADPKRKVFGARSHRYALGEPIDESCLQAFEQKYQISLPDDYRAFLLQIANGGKDGKHNQHAAGPYYGILSLENSENYHFSQVYDRPCLLTPRLTTTQWEALLEDKSISDSDIDGGILIIVDQGCTYYNGLVLNGKYKGRVVYLNVENAVECPPFFAFEDNFLDWYERWLDEIISGDLLQKDACWFGMAMGGDESTLLQVYQDAETLENQLDCLTGLLVKHRLNSKTLDFISRELHDDNNFDLQQKLLFVLTKHDYPRAKTYLQQQKQFRHVVEAVHFFAREHAADWVDYLYQHLPHVNNKDDLSNGIWILETANDDYGELLIPLTQSPDVEIRKEAYDFLGLLCNRKTTVQYIACLEAGEKDENKDIRKMASMKLKHLNKNLTEEKFNLFAWIKKLFSKE